MNIEIIYMNDKEALIRVDCIEYNLLNEDYVTYRHRCIEKGCIWTNFEEMRVSSIIEGVNQIINKIY